MFKGLAETIITIVILGAIALALLSEMWKALPGFWKVILVIVVIGSMLGLFKRKQ